MPNNGGVYISERSKLKTGDIVLFSGKGRISEIIKWATGSKYSHVGLIVYLEGIDLVAIWESTVLSNVADIETGMMTKGVQLVPLSDRIGHYKGDGIFVRKLNNPLTDDMLQKLWDFRKAMTGKAYETHKLDLLKTLWENFSGKEDLSSVFCSELTAESLQKMGLLYDTDMGGLPSDKYRPDHFSQDGDMKLLDNYEYGPEIRIA